MAERTRIEIRTPTGRTNFVSPARADELIKKKSIRWTDGTHLYAISSPAPGMMDCSNRLTSRCQWIPMISGYGGPTVLQLV